MCNAHKEADVIIVNESKPLVYDNYVFILLPHFYCGKNLNCGVIIEAFSWEKSRRLKRPEPPNAETSQIIFQEYMHLMVVIHHIFMKLEKLQH